MSGNCNWHFTTAVVLGLFFYFYFFLGNNLVDIKIFHFFVNSTLFLCVFCTCEIVGPNCNKSTEEPFEFIFVGPMTQYPDNCNCVIKSRNSIVREPHRDDPESSR